MADPCGYSLNGKEYKTKAELIKALRNGELSDILGPKASKKFGIEKMEENKDLKGTVRDLFKASIDAIKFTENTFKEKIKTTRLAVDNAKNLFKDSLSKKQLTKAEYSVVLNKLSKIAKSSEANLEANVNDFVDYVDRALGKVEGREFISNYEKLRKNAIKNLSEARIDMSQEVLTKVGDMLALKPNSIPDSVKDLYSRVLDVIGKKGSKLEINDINKLIQDVDMVNSVTEKAMSEAEPIESKEVEGKAKKEVSEEEVKSEIKSINENIKFVKSDRGSETNKLRTKEQKGIIDYITSNISNEFLRSLSFKELKNVNRLLKNLNGGAFSSELQDLKNNIDIFKRQKSIDSAVRQFTGLKDIAFSARVKAAAAKLFGSKIFFKDSYLEESAVSQQLQRFQKYAIDSILNNVKGHPVFSAVFGESAIKLGSHNTFVEVKSKQINDIYKKLVDSKSTKPDAEKEIMLSNIRDAIYSTQRLHDLGGNKNIHKSIADYIDGLKRSGRNVYQKQRTIDLILEEYQRFKDIAGEDGSGYQKYFESLEAADKQLIKDLDNYYSGELSDMAASTSYFDSQKSLNMQNRGIYRPADFFSSSSGKYSIEQMIKGASEQFLSPSAKSGNLIEKTGATGDSNSALNFTDRLGTAEKYTRDMSLQYHLLNESKVATKLLDKLLSKEGYTKEQKEAIATIKDMYENSIKSVIDKEFSDYGIWNKFESLVTKTVLAGAVKFTSEFASNVVNSVSKISEISEGITYLKEFENNGISLEKILYNTGLPQGSRLLSGGFGEVLTAGADVPFEKRVTRNKDLSNEYKRKIIEAYRKTNTEEAKMIVEEFHNALISFPDLKIALPLSIGQFSAEFTKLTGKKPDFKKISEGDVDYMDKYSEQIKEASLNTEIESSKIISSKNEFVSPDKYISSASDSAGRKAFAKANSFFRNHMSGQSTGSYVAIKKAQLESDPKAKKEAIKVVAQKVASQAIYNAVNNKLTGLIFAGLVMPLFGGKRTDDGKEKEVSSELLKLLISGSANMITAGSGAFASNIANVGLSYGEKELGDEIGLRNNEDEYEKTNAAIQTSYDWNKTFTQNSVNLASAFTGSKGLAVSRASDVINPLMEGSVADAMLSGLGTIGVVPLYKDIRTQQIMFSKYNVPTLKQQAEIIKTKDASKIKKMEQKKLEFLENQIYNFISKSDENPNGKTKYIQEYLVPLTEVFEKNEKPDGFEAAKENAQIKLATKKGLYTDEIKEFSKKNKIERALWLADIIEEYEGKQIPKDIIKKIKIYQAVNLINMSDAEKAKVYYKSYKE